MGEEDVINSLYNKLIEDPFIAEHATGRIKFYEYPDTGEVSAPFIIIDPLDVPLPGDYADDTWLTYDYIYQVDVWSKDRQLTRQLSFKVAEILWGLNFGNYGGSGDEWDRDTGIFRQARRFRGKVYRNLIEGEEEINAK